MVINKAYIIHTLSIEMSAENTRRIKNLLKVKVTYNYRLKDLKKIKVSNYCS